MEQTILQNQLSLMLLVPLYDSKKKIFTSAMCIIKFFSVLDWNSCLFFSSFYCILRTDDDRLIQKSKIFLGTNFFFPILEYDRIFLSENNFFRTLIETLNLF